ncbi:MAG: 5-formyltetrahydrofolate cyclo-ligase, partial [Alphaproteobacteria bacterium]
MAIKAPFKIDAGGREAQAHKRALRRQLLRQRQVMDLDLQSTTQWKVINHLRSLHSSMAPAVVAVYAPVHDEIDLMPWVRELWRMGESVVLPRVVERGHPLVFNLWLPDAPMDTDRLGLPCASGPELMPALVVIPSLGYNRKG